jgi:hypothetical protein
VRPRKLLNHGTVGCYRGTGTVPGCRCEKCWDAFELYRLKQSNDKIKKLNERMPWPEDYFKVGEPKQVSCFTGLPVRVFGTRGRGQGAEAE